MRNIDQLKNISYPTVVSPLQSLSACILHAILEYNAGYKYLLTTAQLWWPDGSWSDS